MEKHQDWWPSDGHDHRDVTLNSIYLNDKITRFLESERISLIIASKGMGKTLLIRVKHHLLRNENSAGEPDSRLEIIPADNKEFDEPQIKTALSRTGFSDLLMWKGIWSLSILLSILTHILTKDDIANDKDFYSRIDSLDIDNDFKYTFVEDVETGKKNLPSHYLTLLLHKYSEKELQKLVRSLNVIDDISRSYIQSGVVVLIDAFDQTLREAFEENIEAWKAGQLGLAKAAHSLFTANHHIKIIATIRQEAWAGFIDDQKEVIQGKSILLDYTERELRSLFEKAIARYTDATSIEDFFGLQGIPNRYCSEQEEPFSYLFRHSTGTPRALMHFGRALAEAGLRDLDKNERAKTIRHHVNNEATRTTLSDYLLSQKQYFLKTLTDENRVWTFLRFIPANVLTANALVSINQEFCDQIGIPFEESHPFCDLFNIGLLGQVRQDLATGGYCQYFRKPYEFDWHQEEILQKDAIYLVHPGLASAIGEMRSLQINRVNIVGTGRRWITKNDHDGIPKVFISYSRDDTQTVEKILTTLQSAINLRFPTNFWFDREKIPVGHNIHQAVESGLAEADVVILFASKKSMASGWVEHEWRAKHQQEIESKRIRLFVVIIDDLQPSQLPEFLSKKLALIMAGADMGNSIRNLADSVCDQAKKIMEQQFPLVE